MIKVLDNILNPDDLEPNETFKLTEERLRIISDVLKSGWVNDGYHGYSNLANASAHKLLNAQDLNIIAEEIARIAPRAGSAWREFLGVLSDENQLGEALRIVDEEISATDPTLPLFHSLKIEKIQILKALERYDEAEKLVTEFDSTDLDLPKEYLTILRNLEKR